MELVDHVDDGRAVLGTDVRPDGGRARRDAGHVAEATGRQAQQGGVLVRSLVGDAHQRRGGQVRDVGHDGDERIVAPCDDCTVFMPTREPIVGREGVYLTRPMA